MEGEVQAVGVAVSAAVQSALEGGVAAPGPEHPEPLRLEQHARGPPGLGLVRQRRQHLQE